MARLFDIIFPDRIHRIDFVVRFAICTVLTDVWAKHLPLGMPSAAAAPRIILWWIGAVVVGIYWLFFVYLPRLRDAAMSPWWLVISLLPLLNLVLAPVLAIKAPSRDIGGDEGVDMFWT